MIPKHSSRPRTILHLIDTGGPGGAETVFRNVIVGLGGRWRSVAVVPVRDWLYEDLRRHRVEPVLLDHTRGTGLLRTLVRLIRKYDVDLIHTHLLSSAVYASVAAIPFGIPVVSTIHGLPDLPTDGRWARLKVRGLSRRRNRIVFVSGRLRDQITALDVFPGSQSRVVLNGLDLDSADPSPRGPLLRLQLSAEVGDFLVGAVGNLRPAKDYHTLLRAVADLRSRGVPVKAVIAGEGGGELRTELLALRKELDLEDRVQFLGFRSDVDDLLRAFDVYICSSRTEGFSLSTVEALALEKPVVATRSGGPEEILRDEETGLLVPIETPRTMADALDRLYRDPALGVRLGKAGRLDVLSRFSRDRMVADYEEIYLEALGESSVTGRPGTRIDHRAR